ncbi:hypothetical protein [Halalkalibacterium ligniniphilum]|nr:hypothetical protein [Halalkalibacterium ligniniphilum]
MKTKKVVSALLTAAAYFISYKVYKVKLTRSLHDFYTTSNSP